MSHRELDLAQYFGFTADNFTVLVQSLSTYFQMKQPAVIILINPLQPAQHGTTELVLAVASNPDIASSVSKEQR